MSATEAELQAWVRERLAAFKVPVAIRFVADTLPRNANGQILKKDLKALVADRDAYAASRQSRNKGLRARFVLVLVQRSRSCRSPTMPHSPHSLPHPPPTA